jgi:signal peptidase I
MEPTLHCARPGFRCEAGTSDRVLANRLVYRFRSPRRGEIVVFTTPARAAAECGASGTYVKRLIALPGETWQERDGVVYIDGTKLDEPYLEPGRRDDATWRPRRIPAGHYFFMGDNRRYSCDSRRWGSVPRASLIGQVFATYWPPRRLDFR